MQQNIFVFRHRLLLIFTQGTPLAIIAKIVMCTVPYTFIQMLKELRSGTYNNSAGGTYYLLFMNPIPDIKRGGWRFQATNHFVRDNGRLSEAFIKNYDLEIFPGNAQSNFQHREGHRRLVLFLTVSSKGSSFESPFEGNKFVLFFLFRMLLELRWCKKS